MAQAKSLPELEQDVERARARLAADIALLRAPQTYDSARDSVMSAADEYRVQTMDAVREKVTTASTDFMDTVKAKVQANPLAALAIAAGVGYRLYRHPPIASLLIGLGAVALARTDPDDDSLTAHRLVERTTDQATRLKDRAAEQVSRTAGQVADLARDATGAAEEKLHALQDAASEKLTALTTAASDAATRTYDKVSERVGDAADAVRGVVGKETDAMSAKARDSDPAGRMRAALATDSAIPSAVGSLENDPTLRIPARRLANASKRADEWSLPTENRDAYLLGFAALAIGAAVGIARWRREDEEVVVRSPPRARILG